MKTKAIGILGGLGPETTSEFYLDLVRTATVRTRPPVCIWSLPLNLQKESEYISTGRHLAYYFSLLNQGAATLQKAGCERIVIPCNTVHEFHRRLTGTVSVPITNLIEVVGNEVRSRGWQTVFLMATSRTLKTRLYQKALSRFGVNVITPSLQDQKQLDSLIQGLLGNKESASHQNFLERLVSRSKTGKIILGCTDLQLLFPASEDVIDSMHTLAVHTARQINTKGDENV